MSGRLGIETLEEIHFPAPVRDGEGHINPAPPSAQRKREDWEKTWLVNHPRLPHEKPMVSMGPRVKGGVEGYSVRKEIIYKP